MDCDGTRAGYDIELTRAVSSAVRIPVIASGGAGNVEHFYDALTAGGASAVLAASVVSLRRVVDRRSEELSERPRIGSEMSEINFDEIKFDERGLVPAIVQNAETREVLTLAYMNRREPRSNDRNKANVVLVALAEKSSGTRARRQVTRSRS